MEYITLPRNLSSILIWKIKKITNDYNKNKNERLIILIIKYEEYNNEDIYKWRTNVYSSKKLCKYLVILGQ